MSKSPTKILIVEDDLSVAKLELRLLQDQGYALKHVMTGAEALEALSDWRPAIIILDMVLPDMNGIQILTEAAKIEDFYRPDVIAVSARHELDMVYGAYESGVMDFVRKPFVNREFCVRVKAIVDLRGYRKATESNLRRLSRYFSQETITGILDGRISDTLSGEMVQCSVMIFDLRNSTAMGEQMVPGLFFQFLTAFFGTISDIVYNHSGSVSRFTGDGFLATFGLSDYSLHATQNAVACALELRKAIALYNARRPPYLKTEVGYGIGLTTGDVYAGNVGSVHKLEYTIFGDAVNLAARLESMTKNAKVDILLDAKTREICGDRLQVKKMQTTSVRGKSESVTMYFPEAFNPA
jgi:class 3 adenylate cyclase